MTNYTKKNDTDEKSCDIYDNIFVFTGDSRKKNISTICKKKEIDAYLFQRQIKYANICKDKDAIIEIKKDRKKALTFFATLLLKKLETPFGYKRECKTLNLIPKSNHDVRTVHWIDPLEQSKLYTRIGTPCTRVYFYKQSNLLPPIKTMQELHKNECSNIQILGYMTAYTKPCDENLLLYMGHNHNSNYCSTEQAVVREGGYKFIFTDELPISNSKYVSKKCNQKKYPTIKYAKHRLVYGDYVISFDCTNPLLIHFESDCIESSLIFGSSSESKKYISFCENKIGTTREESYFRLIHFEYNNEYTYGICQGSEVTIVNKCHIKKHIRIVLTFPCTKKHSKKCTKKCTKKHSKKCTKKHPDEYNIKQNCEFSANGYYLGYIPKYLAENYDECEEKSLKI